MKKAVTFVSILLMAGCATTIPMKQATMISQSGQVYKGSLVYDGPYSGNLVFPGSEDRESFAGRFTVVDKTAVKKSSANVVIPSGGVIPGIGEASSTATDGVDAEGYWIGEGDKGSTIKCTLAIGMQGHGAGKCSANNGQIYDITI